jgi:hypothetical protein
MTGWRRGPSRVILCTCDSLQKSGEGVERNGMEYTSTSRARLVHLFACGIAACVLHLLLEGPVSADDDDWKYEVLHLKNGETMRGLIVRETPAEISFQSVRRKPGRPTLVFPITLPRDQIDSIDNLDEIERDRLAARIKALDPSGKGELLRMQNLDLKAAPWGKDGKGKALSYQSVYFQLVSNSRDDIVRRSAVRLEQVYFAYTRHLPPRFESADATTILLAQSLADYQKLVKDQGSNLLNPAYYDAADNKVVCYCELQKLGDEMEKVRSHHQQLLDDFDAREAELKKIYKNKVPPELQTPIADGRKKVHDVIEKNEKAFKKAFEDGTRRLMQRLYHEAFHAYLNNFVYPPSEGELPRWLNEGLAQVFEFAILDGEEIRVGQVEKERLARAQDALKKGDLVGVADLLKSGSKQFLVAHATESQDSDRYYVTSWAVAHYLLFDRRVLGTKAMDEYVHALHRKRDPLDSFKELIGQPLPRFEKDFKAYLENLRSNGTVGKLPPK